MKEYEQKKKFKNKDKSDNLDKMMQKKNMKLDKTDRQPTKGKMIKK